MPQSQRNSFLVHATTDGVAEVRKSDPSNYEKANYGAEFALLTGYWPSAAWAWLVSDKDQVGIIGYNDV